MKIFILITISIIALIVAGIWRSRSLQANNPDIISQNGIHWHSQLEIRVNGNKVEIPPNIGLVGTHNPVHTHDEDSATGTVHMEFPALVRKTDIRLGEFFRIWNKDMRSFGTNMNMAVNGVTNTEYENYEMHDKDKIVIEYTN